MRYLFFLAVLFVGCRRQNAGDPIEVTPEAVQAIRLDALNRALKLQPEHWDVRVFPAAEAAIHADKYSYIMRCLKKLGNPDKCGVFKR